MKLKKNLFYRSDW